MGDLEQEIEGYISQQFEIYQLSEDAGISTAAIKAANIQKHIQLLVLNNGISQLTVTGTSRNNGTSNENGDDLSALLLPFLLRFIDAAVTKEMSADNKDAIARVLEITAALACTVSFTCQHFSAVDAILARAQLFSEVSLERLRTTACMLLGSVAVQLRELLLRSHKHLKEQHQRQGLEANVASCLGTIETALLPRLTDKSQAVRQCAIEAIGKLLAASSIVSLKAPPKEERTKKEHSSEATEQENEEGAESEDEDEEEENLALNGLIWSMWHDPSVANRVEAIQAVPISTYTVDHIVARIQDVKEKVRVAALDALRRKVDPRVEMTEEHFCDILQYGLTERCEATKDATVKLICTKWMKAAKFDPVELVRIMGVTVNETECENALKVILKTVRSGDHSPIQELSDPEIRCFCANVEKAMVHLKDSSVVFDEYQLFYTRVACSTAKESNFLTYAQKESILTKVAPDIPTLCDLFQKHLARFIESVQEEDQESEDQESFVCLQLLQLAKVAGLQEEGSRRHFASVMTKTLSAIETPEDLIEECVESLRAAYEDDENNFFDAISAILDALMSFPKARGDLVLDEEVISETTTRVLFLFSVVLEKATPTLSTHELIETMFKIILSAVSSSTKSIRELGVSCFGKLGLLSQKNTVLSEFKPILLKIACNEGEALQCRGQALLALADWALLYPEVLHSHDGHPYNLIECIYSMIGHSNECIVAIAAEVGVKLSFSGRIKDEKLLGRLLAVFLDPNSSKERNDDAMDQDGKALGSSLRVHQLLSLFFTAFCLKSADNRSLLLNSIREALLVASSFTKTKKRSLVFPLVKLVEYVCSIVIHNDAGVIKQDIEHRKNDQDVSLSSSVQVAQFLVKQDERLSVTQRRALYKYLGAQDIDVLTGDKDMLLTLNGCIEELAFIADASNVKLLRPLTQLLHDLSGEIEEHDGPGSSDDDTVTEHSDDQSVNNDDQSSGGQPWSIR
ncbi:nuclear condensing complex subunit [Nitzschia inconspicua]|uniref:Nuclear condensing complex subunit n=1 Tax=Nitzschia inconspicua TaxID=303405 RepID=A0A9K3PDP9_9STRA|nr:nuclear condensing complex subunit [Nitzschia inconspicua]